MMLNDLLKKNNLTVEDIEEEEVNDYYVLLKEDEATLFCQMVKLVNYNLNFYSVKLDAIKALGGSHMVTCTAAEFIEIKAMFDHYNELYKKEKDIFYYAFLTANKLLTKPPKDSQQEPTAEEYEKYLRAARMSVGIKAEGYRRRIESGEYSQNKL